MILVQGQTSVPMNKIEIPRQTQTYMRTWFMTEETLQTNGNNSGKIGYVDGKKNSYPILYRNVNSRWIKDINVKARIICS